MINKCSRLLPFLIIFVTLTILAVSVSAAVADDVYIYLPLVNQTSYSANTTWATVIGYPEGISQHTRSVVEVSDGAFVFAGRWYESDNSIDPADALVSKITHHGTLAWQRRFDGYWADDIYDVEELLGGDLIVAGDAIGNAKPMNYTWLARLDGRGSIVWQKFYSLRIVEDILPLSNGGFVIAGITNNNELWMAEFDAGGDIQWQNWFNGPIALSAAITEDGQDGYLVAGTWQTVSADQLDAHVLHLGSDGNVLKLWAYGDENYNYYGAHALASDGGFFLSGVTEEPQNKYHLWILKAN